MTSSRKNFLNFILFHFDNDIRTKELSHLEMVGSMMYQLTKGTCPDVLEKMGLGEYYTDHDHAVYPVSAAVILAIEKRQAEDPRTLGEIFYLCYDEIAEIQFSEAFEFILSLLRNVLEEVLFLTVEQINLLIDAFVSKLPEYFKEKMLPKVSILT